VCLPEAGVEGSPVCSRYQESKQPLADIILAGVIAGDWGTVDSLR
jgi:hypothetical protein